MVNPFYRHQVLNNPKYTNTPVEDMCVCKHTNKTYRINQDCIEFICNDCDEEIDFMCIGDIADNQDVMVKVYGIIDSHINCVSYSGDIRNET